MARKRTPLTLRVSGFQEPTLSTVGKEPSEPVSTVVTLPAKSHANPLPAAVAGTPVAGPELVSDLQTELTRVGCYDGPINGIWTPQTRQAMITLVQRSNARLPTDKADHVLLALVKNHTGSACGSCPTGQDESPEGRCVPHAIAARVAVLRPVSNSHLSAEEPRIVDVDKPQPSRAFTSTRIDRGSDGCWRADRRRQGIQG